MTSSTRPVLLVALAVAAVLAVPRPGLTHPMGNFSISHYAALRIERDGVRLRYLLDMAEIPTFQEIQASGIVAEANHPSLPAYLARAVETWKEGLSLEVDGRRLSLHAVSSEVIFPPGAGGLPTLKLGVVYRAPLTAAVAYESAVGCSSCFLSLVAVIRRSGRGRPSRRSSSRSPS